MVMVRRDFLKDSAHSSFPWTSSVRCAMTIPSAAAAILERAASTASLLTEDLRPWCRRGGWGLATAAAGGGGGGEGGGDDDVEEGGLERMVERVERVDRMMLALERKSRVWG